MQDYQGNSKKGKSEKAEIEPNTVKPPVEKVVVGTVVVVKPSIGKKFKALFVQADFKGVVHYVISDVLIPAARNMLVDGVESGIRRVAYGDRVGRGRGIGYVPSNASRYSYNTVPNRGSYSPSPIGRAAPPVELGPRRSSRPTMDSYILSSKEEAELVLERMVDAADKYDVVSVGDLHQLLGLPHSHVDFKWGWVFLGDAQIRQEREGYVLDLPQAEPIS